MKMRQRRQVRPSAGGFTIIEAAISVAIVGVLLSCSLTVMASIARQRKVQSERRAAYALDQQMMHEVLSQYFADPAHPTSFGPATGQVRSTFNSVDDYNGYTESPPTFKDGTAMTDFAGWSRSVSVTCVNPTAPGTALAGSTLKSVTVTATAPSRKSYSLTGIRSQYGVNEYVPLVQTNLLTWMGVSVQAGSSPRTARTAARPLNITTTQN